MSVRVCADGGPAAVWDHASLECVLANDLIVACGGVPGETSGACLIARFHSVPSAAMAARRLQWSAQGLAEVSRAYALSILIQSGEEVDRGGIETTPLESTAGSILVTEAAARLLEDLPGYAVRPKAKGAKFREMSWRAAADQTTREADERTLAHMTEQSGRVSKATTLEAAPVQEPAADTSAWSEPEPRGTGRSLLWIGLAAVLVVGVIAAIYFLRTPSEQKVASVTSAQQTSAPAGNSSEPGSTTSQQAVTNGNPQPPSTQPLTRKQQRELERKQKEQEKKNPAVVPSTDETPKPTPPDTKPEKPPESVSGSCPYSADQIPGLLESAEASRGRGKYKEAQRKVMGVLSCSPGNARARELLDQIKRAEAAGDGSSDPQ